MIFGCMTFFHLRGFHPSSQKGLSGHGFSVKLVFFIDFRDFACLTCLDSFLDFYRRIPPRFRIEDSMGLLVLNPERRDETSSAIARVKLRGFVESNNIAFPVQVDRFHVFSEFAKDGTSVVLFDYDQEIIKKFLFPLRQQELDEILGYLRN